MIFKLFNKNNKETSTNLESINIACLLIHAAKIDENYTSEEKEIIKKTVKKLYPDLDNLDDVILKAEQKENDENKEGPVNNTSRKKRKKRRRK